MMFRSRFTTTCTGSLGYHPLLRPPSPLAPFCCGLARLGLSLLDMFSATETTATPDLRDRFVVGAGSTYAVDATGGSADATLPTHTHTATSTVTDPGHNHDSIGSHLTMPLVALLDHFLHHKQLASNRLASRLQPPTPTQEPLALTPTCPRTTPFATL
jgi:hypothetical protein